MSMKLSRFAALTSSLLLAAGATLFGAGQAAATARADFGYVALGDSYSSGVGAGNYDGASGNCKRTTRAYPALWAAAHSPGPSPSPPARALVRVMSSRVSSPRSTPAPTSSASPSVATTPDSPTS